MWCGSCQKAWNQREKEIRGEMTRVEYIKYGKRNTIIRKVSEQEGRGILCPEYRVERKKEQQNQRVIVWPTEAKAQQGDIQTEGPKGIAREKGTERDIRRTFKMLKEVQLNIGVEKVDIHKGVAVKVLLDSSATEMFMDQKMVARHGFRLQNLERPIVVRNINGTNNSTKAIIYQVKVNMYYKGHIKRMRMDICNLERTDIILEMLWL